jgi:hypothetical protein
MCIVVTYSKIVSWFLALWLHVNQKCAMLSIECVVKVINEKHSSTVQPIYSPQESLQLPIL